MAAIWSEYLSSYFPCVAGCLKLNDSPVIYRIYYNTCNLTLPDFFLASTLSLSVTQFSLGELTPRLLPKQCLQCKPVSLDWQTKHLPSTWLQSFNWLGSILPLHVQVSHPWSAVALPSKPAEHLLHSKPSCTCSLHLMQEIVPLSNSLHAADEMFLRHQVQCNSSLSVKSTAIRENKTVWIKV